MIETVQTFIQTVKEKAHMHPLINKADFLIDFVTEGNRVSLCFMHGDVSIIKTGTERLAESYEMSGRECEMKMLLEGKEKLRFLEAKKFLAIKAPFRTILLLESIFYLAKKDQNS